jgi:hypothetical protein
MEFNDRFSREHYSIALSNFRPWYLLRPRYVYDWAEWLMILGGIWLLSSEGSRKGKRFLWFFFAQSAIFFPGWFGVVFLQWPQTVASLFHCRLTREDFVDVPFTWFLAQPPWVVVSLGVGSALYGSQRACQPADVPALLPGSSA